MKYLRGGQPIFLHFKIKSSYLFIIWRLSKIQYPIYFPKTFFRFRSTSWVSDKIWLRVAFSFWPGFVSDRNSTFLLKVMIGRKVPFFGSIRSFPSGYALYWCSFFIFFIEISEIGSKLSSLNFWRAILLMRVQRGFR